MKRKPKSQAEHSDWKPFLVSKKYKDNYDLIFRSPSRYELRKGYRPTLEGTNSPFRLVKIEEKEE